METKPEPTKEAKKPKQYRGDTDTERKCDFCNKMYARDINFCPHCGFSS